MPDQSVLLRPARESDHDVLFALAADLETWEERTATSPAPLTRASFDEKFAAAERDTASGDFRFVIDVDGTPVGSVSLFGFDQLARHAEIGINLGQDARGRGIGTAALTQMVEFGFVRSNLRRIHLQAIASNGAALRSYEKVGFVVEGRQREHAWVRGHYEDIVLMGLLRSEWVARRRLRRNQQPSA